MPDRPEPEPDPVTEAQPPAPESAAGDAEIEAAARITEDDLDAAVAAWRRHAPTRFRDLLEAD